MRRHCLTVSVQAVPDTFTTVINKTKIKSWERRVDCHTSKFAWNCRKKGKGSNWSYPFIYVPVAVRLKGVIIYILTWQLPGIVSTFSTEIFTVVLSSLFSWLDKPIIIINIIIMRSQHKSKENVSVVHKNSMTWERESWWQTKGITIAISWDLFFFCSSTFKPKHYLTF